MIKDMPEQGFMLLGSHVRGLRGACLRHRYWWSGAPASEAGRPPKSAPTPGRSIFPADEASHTACTFSKEAPAQNHISTDCLTRKILTIPLDIESLMGSERFSEERKKFPPLRKIRTIAARLDSASTQPATSSIQTVRMQGRRPQPDELILKSLHFVLPGLLRLVTALC